MGIKHYIMRQIGSKWFWRATLDCASNAKIYIEDIGGLDPIIEICIKGTKNFDDFCACNRIG
ncbi:unnamed protein product [marine sediment metagenome]|uniref:Uncharacterized protein n=1 Tax=marine sediment metagenome TaxID=412755 RepID=X0UG68_9ZZZZ